ncbi:aldehyde ferredoxin oxidoreductase N-terminal domain-containing protein [Neobacillus niacini]|uniref:aldehyde ferredoxin oxidoreductase N-terminal domain-containing protein n=1 Tax=Neobacillus niacini TaxID=86668 RepID=UPI002FFF8DF8
MKGYQGKILRVDLSNRKITNIETKKYAEYVGGHGIGSAIFWDLCKDKTIDGFDPANVVTIMGSPISGTITPSGSGRCEVTGIGVQSYPIGWYTRSNFGGRFSGMMKYAGWDGIVIEGKADKPVWIDVRNSDVKIRDADGLWGLSTWEAQEEIWEIVNKSVTKDGWKAISSSRDAGFTTQKPAVLAIGQAGENLGRSACLIHDAGNGAGQGGFGGVWGSKNLKAISVIGTGSIETDDPNALIEARIAAKNNYAYNFDDPKVGWNRFSSSPTLGGFYEREEESRPQSCMGCIAGCRARTASGLGSESSCVETIFYADFNRRKFGKQTRDAYVATDLLQKYGINAYEAWRGLEYLEKLYKLGVLGPGKEIDCPLDFEQLGTSEFAEEFLRMTAFREGIGDDFAEGFVRAAERWGRLEEDWKTGILFYPYWGCPDHMYDPRAEIEWGFASIVGDRDMNQHDFNGLYWDPTKDILGGKQPYLSAEEVTKVIAEKLVPFENNPKMLDFSLENAYSEDMAKLVSWTQIYGRFWKNSVLFCDWRWPDLYNPNDPDNSGLTGDEGEPKFLNAIIGGNMTFSEGMEIGRKIWNLDNAIYTLQGRHRDMVKFADYIYDIPYDGGLMGSYYLPAIENGEWKYIDTKGRKLDRDKFEEWKSKYYKLEGWDPETGWPTRSALKTLGLNHVADELEKKSLLGKE